MQLKNSAYHFFFDNFLIFVCELKEIYFYFSEENECYFLMKNNEFLKKINIYIFNLHGKNKKITKEKYEQFLMKVTTFW